MWTSSSASPPIKIIQLSSVMQSLQDLGLETKGNMTVRSFLPHITIKYLFQTDSNEDTGQIQGPHSCVGPV